MTRISSTERLFQAIRKETKGLENLKSGSKSSSIENTKNTQHLTQDNLDALIASRIRSIDADDPQKGRHAFRFFLEATLLFELGENLLNDSNFSRLVDEVQKAMESDPELLKIIEEAGVQLLDRVEV